MIKNVTIVSLSSGILGEPFVAHEVELGVKRLEAYGLNVRFAAHACKGMEYIRQHPEKRAEDLLQALADDTDLILCAIGGDDTYRLLPYLFGKRELEQVVKQAEKEKVFLGFSDTTMNHLMLHKAGLNTFYGQAFLPDVCELASDMLPYTRHYLEELLHTGTISCIQPSPVWQDAREDFSPSAFGTAMPEHPDRGFELLQGSPVFSGEILGGCADSLYDIFNAERYADSAELCARYQLFPPEEEWKGKILLLETSEEKPSPAKYRAILRELKAHGVFASVSGVLIGKPMDEQYMEEYKQILIEEIDNPALPVVCNVNIGHATPRCIIPFGVPAVVDAEKQTIRFSKG